MIHSDPIEGEGASARHAADRELVRRAARGDRAAEEVLTKRLLCVPRILAAKNRRAGHPLDDHELADVVQDTLVVLWRKRMAFRGRAALETWAYRVAVIEWLSALRKKGRRRANPAEELAFVAVEESPGLDEDRVAQLLVGLDEVGPPDSDVIRLKHYSDETFEGIGAALEISPNTAKYWYYRGMEKLRQKLRRSPGEGAS